MKSKWAQLMSSVDNSLSFCGGVCEAYKIVGLHIAFSNSLGVSYLLSNLIL